MGLASQHLAAYSGDLERGSIAALQWGIGPLGKRAMKQAGTNINPLQPATSLVTTGPFRFSRNPLYLSLTLLFAGLSLILNSLWGLIALAPVLAILHFGVILREERYLEAKFGESYRQYRTQVRRWL